MEEEANYSLGKRNRGNLLRRFENCYVKLDGHCLGGSCRDFDLCRHMHEFNEYKRGGHDGGYRWVLETQGWPPEEISRFIKDKNLDCL